LHVARAAAGLVRDAPHLELIMEPELSIVMFRRTGWGPDEYTAWSDRLLRDGTAFVVPTSWAGETVLRICIVNPQTTVADIELLVRSLADHAS
jgi:L-2,4-diaminobutyrate decarboxylase